jgi:hypothetical protein
MFTGTTTQKEYYAKPSSYLNHWFSGSLQIGDMLQHGISILGTFAELRKVNTSFAMSVSVRPHGTTRLPLNVFS